MRHLAPILAAAGAAGLAFYYWGLHTPAGWRAYDEMAGMIPFFAGVAGGMLLVAAAAIWLWRQFRGRG